MAEASTATMTHTVRFVQRRDYQFDVKFGAGVPDLLADEPAPLGQGAGPSPVQLLAAAVGNCLADSLLFALRKFHHAPEPISAEVRVEVGRNAEGRLRVLAMDVELSLGVASEGLAHLDRVLGSFESFCTVSGSVRGSIPMTVSVFDANRKKLN